jgi:hypothetical protein
MGKCLDVPEVLGETLVLSMDLVGFNLGNTKDIGRGLRLKSAEKAIQKAVDKENKQLTKQFLKGKSLGDDKAQDMLKNVAQATAAATVQHAQRKLGEGIGCAWKRSPMGIWVDENEWVLYIVVPVLVGGAGAGAGYLYHARVGDRPVGMLTSLVQPHLKFKPIGNLTLGVEELKFVPSERTVQTKVFTKIEWKPVQVGFSVSGGVTDGKVSNFKLQSKVSYKGSGSTSNLNFDVKTFVAHDAVKGLSAGAGVGGSYKTNILGETLRIGAGATWEEQISTAGRQRVWTTSLTLGKDF